MEAELDGNLCILQLHLVLHLKMKGKEEKKYVNTLTDLGYGILLGFLKVGHSLI